MWPRLFTIVMVASAGLSGLAAEPGRATRPAFKGYELYSWKLADGAWSYALLPGTNRLKARREIVAAKIDLAAVKDRLSAFARNEQVFWVAGSEGSSLPDAAAVADLQGYCAKLQIDLHVPQ
jgi:hypothetical protein